jgi:TonB-linked SusC/RagA family outer membrane protein
MVYLKKIWWLHGVIMLLLWNTGVAQVRSLSGTVADINNGELLPGATVQEKGTTNGTITDFNGEFQMNLIKDEPIIIVSFVGYQTQEIPLEGKTTLDVKLDFDVAGLEEVVVVGFGQQTKVSMVSSVTAVNVDQIKLPTSNFTQAIPGKVAGMITFQQSGEPGLGSDNTQFFIRGLSTFGTGKRDPLILIDGVESTPVDMARLQADDVSDFSVLKDAAASSIYGARGANGVILINTKLGQSGAPRFTFRAENRVSTNTRNFQLSDNITYMNLENEAIVTRNPEALPRYTTNKIIATERGLDPYLYPDNDWIDQLIRDYTMNQGYNLNISGGTEKGRYYIAGTYNRDNGNLKVDPINDFNNNIRLQNYSVRSNIDVDLSNSTTLIVRMYGQFDDYTGPIGGYDGNGNYISGGQWIFNQALWTNPVMFPATYPKDKRPFVSHPLFGSSVVDDGGAGSLTLLVNPYAEMVKGYQTYKRSNLMPQLEVKQKLDFITEGLNFNGMTYIRKVAFYRQDRSYDPFFYTPQINPDGSYIISVVNDGGQNSIGTPGTEYLDYVEVEKEVNSQFWAQGILNYNRVFANDHTVGGSLISYLSHYETANPGSLINSLPNRNMGLSGRFTYGFRNKYLTELNFGYNGSERFSESNRFGFFPSFGLGYVMSEEPFFTPLRRIVSNFKLRLTYGKVGNDQIGDVNDRFLYLSNVNLNDGGYGASFGRGQGAGLYYRPGVSISRYANDAITWEVSEVLNAGIDLSLFNNKINLVADAFKQTRTNILQPVSNLDAVAGLMATPLNNYGQARTQGIDLSLDGNQRLTQDITVSYRGTFTYATSEVIKTDELSYPDELSYLSRVGYSISQEWGYIAERLFIDDEEVANTPSQDAFNSDQPLMAGDIRYRDINGDGIINSDDRVPIGYPTQPEIIYGFGSSLLWKSLDFNFYFQGAARVSFFINPWNLSPFVQSGGNQNRILEVIAEDYWSEDDPDVYSFWPRLSTEFIDSNNQQSTWWMRNGSYLRLRQVDIGYTLNSELVNKIGLRGARLYFSGINLFTISQFKLWDVEMGGNGLGYPIQSVYTMGLTIDF